MIQIIKCHIEGIDRLWPVIEPWLGRCLKSAPPWWTLEYLEKKCRADDYIIWLISHNYKPCAVALSELEQFDNEVICNVPWIGGRGMKLWLPQLQATIEAWAKDGNAKYLAGCGRTGWSRVAGMKETGTILYKEI